MKTSIKITLVFWFLSFCSFSQHDHDGLEILCHSKTLTVFENDLELTANDYRNQDLINFVDNQYQNFQNNLRNRLNNGIEILEPDFEIEYQSLVINTREQLSEIPEAPPAPPTPKIFNGPCVNMDFETGDFTGWDLTRGDVDGSVPYSFVGEFPVGPSAYHQIFGGGFDPVTGIPTVNPLGGAFSTRLGNGTGTGARAARMKQTFLVDATNYLYTYSYAVVFQSPNGHALNELPYFTVRVFDEFGANVPCGEYSVIADAASAPSYSSTIVGGVTILYQNWQTVFTNLSAYIGQNVTIEFTSGDCSLTGHYGYAYVDASCAMTQITASNNIICTGDNAILTAPVGAASYLWNTGETTQAITVSSGGNYSCTLTPFQGGGCDIVLDIDITENPTPTASFSSNTIVACVNDAIDFTDLSTIPNPGVIANYRWNFGDGTITPLSNGAIVAVPNTVGTYTSPSHTYTSSGVFNVELFVESTDGCTDNIIIPVTINVLPVVAAGVDQVVCQGTAVTLNGSGANGYVWDNGITNGIPFLQAVGMLTYTVTGTDVNGCQNTDQVDVTVNALPNVNAGIDQAVCQGTAVTLNGSGANGYVWDNGITNGIPFLQAVGMLTYTVTGTDVNGCQNTDQVNVTVNALPNVNAGIDQAVCQGTAVTLNGSGANGYIWDNGITNGIPFLQAVGMLTYTVTGTDVNGCQNTDQVQVLVNPLPIVNAGVDQIVCLGTSITLNGSGANFYAWDHGITDGIAFGQPVGTIIYTVTGTDINGCQNTDQVSVTVNPLPIVNAGPDQVLCEGSMITLNGNGAQIYLWDNGVVDGVPFNQIAGITNYTVIGTDINGCVNTDQVSVRVNVLPVVNAGVDQVVCQGTAVTLNGNGANGYIWNNGVTNGVPFIPAVGTLTYTVIGTDVNGCQNTDQVDVTVNALPNVNAGIDQEVCDGVATTLTGNGAIGYSWSNGVIDGIPFVQGVGSIIYTLTGTGINGCQNTDQVTVLVNPNPNIIAGVDQTSCENEWITLSAIGAPILIWDNGVINNVPFQQAVGTVNYNVTGTLPTGCFSTDIASVTILQSPIVSTNDIVICEGEAVILNGNGAVSYTWTGGISNGQPFYPNQSGAYIVTGTAANGCTSQATAFVTVNPAPVIDFNILNLHLTTVDATTGFDNLSTGAVSYEWNFSDGSPINTQFEPTHTFPEDQVGEYYIELTGYSSMGCPARAVKFVHVFRDYLIYVPNAFTPNNSGLNEVFKPVMTGFDEQGYTMYIFNRWGNLIFETHDMEIGWDGTFHSDSYQVQDGVYTWKIEAKIKDSADSKVFVGHVSLLK